MLPDHAMIRAARFAIACAWIVIAVGIGVFVYIRNPAFFVTLATAGKKVQPEVWSPPDLSSVPADNLGKKILYGRELIAHTAVYLGPKGKVASITNGMNCQNCHLKAGTQPFGNNYSAVASTYPKFRDRSGAIESIEKRVNDCMERSLNGQKLPEQSNEMKAMVAYIRWVGKAVPRKSVPDGAGILKLPYLDRQADTVKGKVVYVQHCARCHGTDGTGVMNEDGKEWRYPPLYGANSFNIGAGLLRLSRFAGYVKANMPNDLTTYEKPLLSNEEAWDVAAYITAQPRPAKDISMDWPDISRKPVDHPFGPYADRFSERQHKYGPFTDIPDPQKKANNK